MLRYLKKKNCNIRNSQKELIEDLRRTEIIPVSSVKSLLRKIHAGLQIIQFLFFFNKYS